MKLTKAQARVLTNVAQSSNYEAMGRTGRVLNKLQALGLVDASFRLREVGVGRYVEDWSASVTEAGIRWLNDHPGECVWIDIKPEVVLGKLTVIGRAKRYKFLVQCNCGETAVMSATELQTRRSCGWSYRH